MVASVALSAALLWPSVLPASAAASPRDQAYLVCANGYEGDAGDCKRVCGRFLKMSGNPLRDMKRECLSRVNERKTRGVPPPD